MKSEIAFIGPPEYVEAFRLLGFACWEARSIDEASSTVDAIRRDFKLLFVSRDVWERPPEEGITVLPGVGGSQGKDGIKELIHQALGKDINL